MNSREFLIEVVEPDVEDCERNSGNLRIAFHAVHSVDALTAHIFTELRNVGSSSVFGVADDSAFRAKLALLNEEFKLLRDLAKALKHVELSHGKPVVTSANQVAIKSLDWDEARWDEMRWDGEPQVTVRTDAGETRPIEAIVRNALSFLQQKMSSSGLL